MIFEFRTCRSAASGSMVKTGTTSLFQTASGVTKLRILSGLFFSRQPKAIASDAQMHGGLATQKVVADACVDSLQGVSPVNGLLSFPGVARTLIKGAHGMLCRENPCMLVRVKSLAT